MVVLARASGIPARFVSGYASGEYDVSNAQYVVRELNAHSWAEVYFRGIGWVEFEPTGNQPQIERLETNETLAGNDGADSSTPDVLGRLINWNLGALFFPLATAFSAILIYFAFIEPLYFKRMAPLAAIEVLYRRLYRSGRPLAGEPARAETVYEFTNKLIQNIQAIDLDFKQSSYQLQNDVSDLAAIYQAALFSDRRIEHQHVRHALRISNRLRWSLMMERIKYFFWKRNKTSR
jgi:hypothetical protein